MSMPVKPDELISYIAENYGDHVSSSHIDKGHAVVESSVERIEDLLQKMRDDTGTFFDMFMDMTVVDWMERKPRFDVVYHLYSVKHNHRLRIKVPVEDGQVVPSSVKLWKIANWFEREMWDLYGIRFSGHPNLKRLLLYDEFKGHPLRKDYPYDKRQPRLEYTSPSKDSQVKMKDINIHRP